MEDNKNAIGEISSLETAQAVVRELDARRAENIKLLHVENQTILAEYFVIATGNSNTQLRALDGYIEEKLGELGEKPLHVEGFQDGSWILLDYAGVIIHLFTPQTRQFYHLEKLWAASEEVDISSLLTEN